jgi:hypothetical protein
MGGPETDPRGRPAGGRDTVAERYHPRMKKLIGIAIVLAVAAIIYKVLTTEVPIDEA